MGAPISFLGPRLSLNSDDLDFLELELGEQNNLIEAGVKVEGDAAAYALVWEWGNARQTQIGPKTTIGVNPDGKRVFLSIQAPTGYIRVNEPLYQQILAEEMAKVIFRSSETGAVTKALTKAAEAAASRICQIIKEHAPVDTGQLESQIKVVKAGDPLLDEMDDNPLYLNDEE